MLGGVWYKNKLFEDSFVNNWWGNADPQPVVLRETGRHCFGKLGIDFEEVLISTSKISFHCLYLEWFIRTRCWLNISTRKCWLKVSSTFYERFFFRMVPPSGTSRPIVTKNRHLAAFTLPVGVLDTTWRPYCKEYDGLYSRLRTFWGMIGAKRGRMKQGKQGLTRVRGEGWVSRGLKCEAGKYGAKFLSI